MAVSRILASIEKEIGSIHLPGELHPSVDELQGDNTKSMVEMKAEDGAEAPGKFYAAHSYL